MLPGLKAAKKLQCKRLFISLSLRTGENYNFIINQKPKQT